MERAAVDDVLGSPASRWDGATRRDPLDGHIAYGGHAARSRRHLLLPSLHALQAAAGWISPGGLNYVCERLTVPPAEAYGVATFYAMFTTEYRAPRVVHVCDDIACKVAGADRLCSDLEQALGPEGEGEAMTWVRSPCLGRCDAAPAALLQLAGEGERSVSSASPGGLLAALRSSPPPAVVTPPTSGGDAPLRLLRRVGVVDPSSLDDYRAHGGFEALRRAFELGPAGVLEEVTGSNLLGRGGAAFPTGRKWQAVAAAPSLPHYLICNADESEPGTFKDRVLMEGDPFAVVEAMTIAGYATGCGTGYVYIRGEYPEEASRLGGAIAGTRAAELLGSDILGSGFGFDIEIRRGAGAYICGEETALMESIEGFRGEPRSKPPYPTEYGLFGKPTVVNNVETLMNVLDIVTAGADAFAASGTAASTGTRLFCVSGSVEHPGVYELGLGSTLGHLLDLAGAPAAAEIQAILLGGAAGSFVTAADLHLPLSFEAARERGVTLGSGAVVVFDRAVDLPSIVARIARFFRDESCGQCVPCRVGTARQEEALHRLGTDPGEIDLIADIARAMADASICGLGHAAASAVQSALALGLIGAAP